MIMKVLSVIIRSTPYQNYLAEIQDLILAQSAFFDHLNILFIHQGVLQLINQQNPPKLTHKNFSNIYKTFRLYDIDSIYVDEQSLKQFNLQSNQLLLDSKIIANAEVKQILDQSNFILNY
ncbi:MAG: sulfurtransferase complex subunit TusC [Gammaproteobacteria bacterium]|nr:MAG: sulfurtransferase complex subunit TusC [Gammaproteobacteria bacterium]